MRSPEWITWHSKDLNYYPLIMDGLSYPFQEYADGADLFTVLQKYGGRLSERLAVQLVMDPFIRVLHYLHSRGVIHRDIKVCMKN